MYLILRIDYSVQIYVLQGKDLMKFHLVLKNSIEPIIDVVIVEFFFGGKRLRSRCANESPRIYSHHYFSYVVLRNSPNWFPQPDSDIYTSSLLSFSDLGKKLLFAKPLLSSIFL